MLELCRDFYFMEEASWAEACRQFGPEDLQRNHAAVLRVPGEVDSGHPSMAELALEHVTVGQCGPKSIGGGVGQLEILPEVLY